MLRNLARHLVAALALATASGQARAQSAPPEQEFEGWLAVVGTAAFGDSPHRPSLWLDTHARRGADGTTAIVRPGVGVRLAPSTTLWLGYAYVPFFPDDGLARTDEHRMWQQSISTLDAGAGVSLQFRGRMEQRFRPGEPSVGFRARNFVRLGWMKEGSKLGLVVWDEWFAGLNTVSWGPQAGYDQNRAFVGAAIAMDRSVRLELGYLLVHQNRATDRLVHAVAMTLFVAR